MTRVTQEGYLIRSVRTSRLTLALLFGHNGVSSRGPEIYDLQAPLKSFYILDTLSRSPYSQVLTNNSFLENVYYENHNTQATSAARDSSAMKFHA